MQETGLLSRIKSMIVPDVERIRRIRGGLLRGLKLPINLQDQSQLYIGTLEREHHSHTRKMTTGINTFIDVGASTGPYTIFALANTNAETVISIEPRRSLHQDIRHAVEINGLNIERLHLFSFLAGEKGSEETTALDTLKDNITYPCFIKCDVDGPEAKVLEGAKGILKGGDTRLVIETHSKEAEQDCIRFLDNLSYSTSVIHNAWWRTILPEQRPTEHNRWLSAKR